MENEKFEVNERNNFIIFSIIFILLCAGCLLITSQNGLVADESAHAVQTQHFINGEYVFLKTLTVPPTYHLVLTMFALPFNTTSLFGLRIISCILLVVLLLPIAYLVTKKNLQKTIQIMFFPTMFLYFFLIYTDIFSLIFVLFSFYLMRNKKYALSGLVGTFAVFIRQNNIFWLGFIVLYGWFMIKDERLLFTEHFNEYIILFMKYMKKVWSFIFGGIVFIFFILYKGAIVQGDANQHPIALHLGNVWIFLFTFFFVFLFYILNKLPDIIKTIKKNWKVNMGGLFIFCGVMFFENSHLYNQIKGVWFNELLMLIDTNIYVKLAITIPILLSYYAISSTKFDKVEYYLIYPVTLVYLMLSWLIEVRYYFIPMIFFLLLYRNKNEKLEIMTTIYYVLIALLWFSTLVVNPY